MMEYGTVGKEENYVSQKNWDLSEFVGGESLKFGAPHFTVAVQNSPLIKEVIYCVLTF